MKKRSADIIRHLASQSCNEVLECLRDGMDHPDDIAKKLGVVRQSVDFHLLKLSAFGIVERVAVSSVNARPKIVYKMTPHGRALIDSLDKMIERHYVEIERKFEDFQRELDVMLAKGQISEEVYNEKTKRLKKEMDFLNGAD